MVAKEVGRRLLKAGIEVDGKDLLRVAHRYPDEIHRGIKKARMNDRAVTPDTALFSRLSKERLLLSVGIDR
jgi:hypothetical protein